MLVTLENQDSRSLMTMKNLHGAPAGYLLIADYNSNFHVFENISINIIYFSDHAHHPPLSARDPA